MKHSGPALLIGLGDHSDADGDKVDDYQVSDKAKAAAQDLIDAIKSGDAEDVAMAFQKLDDACSSSDEEEGEKEE